MSSGKVHISGLVATVVSLCLFSRISAEQAPSVTIPDGGTLSVPGVMQSGSSAINTSDYEITVVVEALGDATVKVTRPDGVSAGALYFTPIATNGTLTLDLTEWNGCDFRLDGGFITHPGGKLVVKGRDSIVAGYAQSDVRSGFGDKTTSKMRNMSRPIAFGEVEFMDVDGNPYTSHSGIVLSGAFWDAGISSASVCPWSVAEGSVVSLDRRHALAERYVTDGVFDVSLFDLWVLSPAALEGVSQLRVSPGRNLRIVPRTVVSSDSRYFGWNGLSAAKSVFTNNVELLGSGAVLTFSQHYGMTFSGDVRGIGTVRVALEHQKDSGEVAEIKGELDYSGPFEMALGASATNYTFQLKRPVDFSDNPVTLSSGAILHLDYAASETEIPRVSAVSHNDSLPPGAIRVSSKMSRLKIGEVDSKLWVNGYSSFSNTVEIAYLAPGGVVGDNARVAMAPSLVGNEYVRIANPTGNRLYRMTGQGDSVDLRALTLSEKGEYSLVASDGVIYENPPLNMSVEIPQGVSATVLAGTDVATLMVNGEVTVGKRENNEWEERVMLWLDPSRENSWRTWTYNGNEGYDQSGMHKAVGPWGDWREDKGDYYLITDKHYLEAGNTVCPFVVAEGLNGMPYMSFLYDNKRRRMLFYPVGTTNSASSTGGQVEIAPKFAVMVFGSQNGGGQALLGNSSSYYKRGGVLSTSTSAQNPIFANSKIPTWVNGSSVDPSQCSLNGGWQIISVDTSKATVSGIGLLSDKSNTSGMGNQNYAEILFFDEVLSDSDRIAVESYLAEKWGLSAGYRNPKKPVQVRLFGKGAVTLADEACVSGSFSGTVDLNGHPMLFADAELPPTASDVSSIAGRVAWFDPDDESRLNYGSRGTVERMFDQDVDMAAANGGLCLYGATRNPMPVVSEPPYGPRRRWLDYSVVPSATTYGKVCRMQRYGVTAELGVEPVTARTVFMVQDSSKGGGTPFMSTLKDEGELLSPRLTTLAAMPPDPAMPIWRSNSARLFANGSTYLDGMAVDGANQGFNGRAELLTAVGGASFPFGATGYCFYMEGVSEDVHLSPGEIQGEIMVYDCELSSAERGKVEAYLMHKWLGKVNAGYGVYTNLTIKGEGAVFVDSVVQMPQFSPDFTGKVAVSAVGFSFALGDDGNVVGGFLDFAESEVAFPETCVLNVVCASAPAVGRHKLMSMGGFSSSVDWRLNVTVEKGSMRNRSCYVVVEGGNVYLVVNPAGTTIVLR